MPHLSIKYTLNESLKLVLREWRFVLSIIIGPVLVISGAYLSLRLAKQGAVGILLSTLITIVLAFSWVRLAVCCHRFILLGEQPGSFIQGCRWKMRDTWFALYGIGIYLFASFFIFLTALGVSAIAPMLSDLFKGSHYVLFALGGVGGITIWLLFTYVTGRLSLILPATAVDRGPAKEWMDWAWSQSEGNEWPLMFLMGINPSLGWILLNAATATMIEHANQGSAFLAAPIFGLAWGLYFFATVFQVAVLSLSLKQLSGNETEGNPLTVG